MIIRITVAVAAVILAFVVPMIKDSAVSSTQETAKLSIETSGGYTTLDEVQKIARVQIKRGNDKATLIGMDFSFVRGGSSVKRNRTDFPARNEIKVYEFELSELSGKPEKVLIAPITDKGTGSVVSQSNVIKNYSRGSSYNQELPPTVIVSAATDVDFNKIYSYNTGSLKWENGSYSIYKNRIWYLTNGTINYTAPDNSLNLPPKTFTRLLDYPLTIEITEAGLLGAIKTYYYAGRYELSPGLTTPVWAEYTGNWNEQVFQGWFILHNNVKWRIYSFGYVRAYAQEPSAMSAFPPKTGWNLDQVGVSPAPTLEYTLETNATVSYY